MHLTWWSISQAQVTHWHGPGTPPQSAPGWQGWRRSARLGLHLVRWCLLWGRKQSRPPRLTLEGSGGKGHRCCLCCTESSTPKAKMRGLVREPLTDFHMSCITHSKCRQSYAKLQHLSGRYEHSVQEAWHSQSNFMFLASSSKWSYGLALWHTGVKLPPAISASHMCINLYPG